MADDELQVDGPGRGDEGMDPSIDTDWEENEPSPHEGEAGQQESEA